MFRKQFKWSNWSDTHDSTHYCTKPKNNLPCQVTCIFNTLEKYLFINYFIVSLYLLLPRIKRLWVKLRANRRTDMLRIVKLLVCSILYIYNNIFHICFIMFLSIYDKFKLPRIKRLLSYEQTDEQTCYGFQFKDILNLILPK